MIIKGSPITPVNKDFKQDKFECIWFDGAQLQEEIFHKDSLEWVAPYYDTLHFANYE